MTITDDARPLLAEQGIVLAVAAAPIGPLAHAIDAYRQAVAVRVGANAAHRDQPHCLLVQSYRDDPASIPGYQRALAAIVTRDRDQRTRRDVTVTGLTIRPLWHGLEIESPSLLALAVGFAARTTADTGRSHIARRDRLRLVLASGFAAADEDTLSELAHRIIDPDLPAQWEVGLWQCRGGAWGCVWREHPA